MRKSMDSKIQEEIFIPLLTGEGKGMKWRDKRTNSWYTRACYNSCDMRETI